MFLEYRREHRLSQAQLAELLGLDQSYISKVENGLRAVRDLELLREIAERLDVPPERLGLAPTVDQVASAVAPALTITISVSDLSLVEQAGDAFLELLTRLGEQPGLLAVTSRAS